MIELYIIGYILVALAFSIYLQLTTFDDYDKEMAVIIGLTWVVTAPLLVFIKIVDKSADIIRGYK